MRRKLIRSIEYKTVWNCPFCSKHTWYELPLPLEKCPNCKAISDGNGFMDKSTALDDTPTPTVDDDFIEDVKTSSKIDID